MHTPPESLPAVIEDGTIRLTVTPLGRRSADEAVGFVLLPVLMVLVVVSVAYLLGVVGLALSGHDPALTIDSWRPGFLGLGALTWLVATIWYRRQMGQQSTEPVTLELGVESVTLRESDDSVRWTTSLKPIARAEVRTRPNRRLRLVMVENETLEAPLSGIDADGMSWLAATINQRASLLQR